MSYDDMDMVFLTDEQLAFVERAKETVRKETAKEILHILFEQGIDKEAMKVCLIYDVNGIFLAERICEKYGVEVE